MSRTAAAPFEQTGLALSDVAATAAAVYGRVAGVETDPADEGWRRVALAAAAVFDDDGGDEGEVTVPLAHLAVQFRTAYARGRGDEIPDWDALAPKVRLAWEGVVRHLGNVAGMDPEHSKRLGQHEEQMAGHMRTLAQKRGITL
jgi:hypothetical protein